MQIQTIYNYIIINAIPLMDTRVTLLLMIPALMVAEYLQLQVETVIMEERLSYLPMETRSNAMTPYAYFVNQIYGAALVGATFFCAHYLQQLDISRLTIQKHMIKK